MTMQNRLRARVRPAVHACLTAALAASWAPAVLANTGDVPFGVTVSAGKFFVACPGQLMALVADVDAVSANTTGDNVATVHDATGSACSSALSPGVEIYHFDDVTDEAIAEDTTTSDFGEGKSDISGGSFLNGLVTYAVKHDDYTCSETSSVSCGGNTTITDLTFGGTPITGTFSARTEFPVTNLSVFSPSCGVLGAALFTGKLTVHDYTLSPDGKQVDFIPLALSGTLTCAGANPNVVQVNVRDEVTINLISLTATIDVVVQGFDLNIGSSSTTASSSDSSGYN